MTRFLVPAGTLAALTLLGGCAQMQDNMDEILGSTGLAANTFTCDEDRELQLSFADGGEQATIRSGGESVRLDLVDSREGGDTRVYENRSGSVRMVDEGDEVHVQIEGQENFNNCQPDDDDYRRR